jgi:hypothetical protein
MELWACWTGGEPLNIFMMYEWARYATYIVEFKRGSRLSATKIYVLYSVQYISSGANVIIWDEMLSSGTKCYHLG